MSLEDDLAKLERQLETFKIVAKGGEISSSKFQTGAGTPEQRLAQLEAQFQKFTISGDKVQIAGSIKTGFIINANT